MLRPYSASLPCSTHSICLKLSLNSSLVMSRATFRSRELPVELYFLWLLAVCNNNATTWSAATRVAASLG
jgi:hypothetical protein